MKRPRGTALDMPKIAIQTEPYWPIPLEEQLPPSAPAPSVRNIEDHHDGLMCIKIEAAYRNDTSNVVPDDGVFQTFNFEGGGQGRVPAVNAQIIALVVHARCEQYAQKKKRKVQFIITLHGSTDKNKPFKRKYQYTVDGTPDEVININGDSDENENEEEYSDQADDEDVEGVHHPDPVAALTATPGFSGGATPPYVPDVVPHASPNGLAIPGAGGMAIANGNAAGHAALEVARVVQGAFTGALQQQANFTYQIRKDQEINNREMRANQDRVINLLQSNNTAMLERVVESFEKMLEQKQDTLNEIKAMVTENMIFMRGQVDQAVARATSAEDRIRERNRQDEFQTDRMFEVAQRGWEAFSEGMQMQRAVLTREQEMDREMLQEKMQATAQTGRKSAFEGTLDRVLPFAPAILSMMIRKSGVAEESAKLVDALAMHMFAPAAASPNGAPGGGAPMQDSGYAETMPNSTMHNGRPLPDLCVSVREIYQSMTNDQLVRVQQILPPDAWLALEDAVQSRTEASCFASIQAMEKCMDMNTLIQIQSHSTLSPEQMQRLMELVSYVKGQTTTITTNATAVNRDAQHQQQQSAAQAPQAPQPARPFATPPAQTPSGTRRGVPPKPTASTPTSESGT